MTRDNLITAAPWIIFSAGLSALWIRLLRPRRALKHQPGRNPANPVGSGEADPAERISGPGKDQLL